MPHLANRILTPHSFTREDVLFDIPIRPYPGKPIVCMLPREEAIREILIPKEVADKYQPDFGVVAAFRPRLDARQRVIYGHDLELRPGMLVAIKPYTGVWYTHADFPWIPEGRLLKILGTAEDWSKNVLANLECA